MLSPKRLMLIALATAATGFAAATVPAHANICHDLWVQRNSIYKAYGYCFKTEAAINYFGNGGCIYKNEAALPISKADMKTILAIKKKEKQLGCL